MQYQVFTEQQTSFWHLFQVQGYGQFNLPLCGSISPLTTETTVESKSRNWLFTTQTFWDMSAGFLFWNLRQEGVVYFSFSSSSFLFLLHIILSAHVYTHTWRLEGSVTCLLLLFTLSFITVFPIEHGACWYSKAARPQGSFSSSQGLESLPWDTDLAFYVVARDWVYIFVLAWHTCRWSYLPAPRSVILKMQIQITHLRKLHYALF